ncbi:MAG: NADH-quinone oxidoreductase subunit J [Bacillota bacterium]|jgi:NADH-quinone oxidoreductase subunit J|uniref:NADH-quinone oxidoreductase subunit J n=1 Tax=Thermanaerosceptrum fracticalcis TaxID=1712410 RepID=A0A7G6E1G7_THEFR|nr:NADH-quinone oxidoreductase subunit J [Thermanaerosceptrum fracticalcis]QNB45921.1 NADH-quinone oxidoreductase subunit J [Thermanaerosceptrum fracticalcis]
MDIFTLAFGFIALVTILSALGVVLFKNIVHSALSLVVTFIGVAALYVTLQADYVALVQVLVYGGAVSVLIVFAIMLIQRGTIKETNLFGNLKIPAFVVSLATVGILSWLISITGWQTVEKKLPETTVTGIAELMLTKYAIPFEVAAILLLVALIGAIVIGKEVKNAR